MAAVATSLVPVSSLPESQVLQLHFWSLSGLSPSSPASFLTLPPQEHQGLIYSALHPLFMVIGFILISGEVHRWLPGSRSLKKSVHLSLQAVALASGIFGIWTKFQGKKGIVADFCSLHSLMGLISILLFGAQWLMGFLSFWHRGEVCAVRLRVLPWHVFIGLYTYGLAVATAETGLLEKLTFLQTKRNVSKHCAESMLVNSLGLGLALVSGIVILAAASPKCQALLSKLIYSSETKKYMLFCSDFLLIFVRMQLVIVNSVKISHVPCT